MMKIYESLSANEQAAIEAALDTLKDEVLDNCGFNLMNDDRAARAAEALARYIAESKEGP